MVVSVTRHKCGYCGLDYNSIREAYACEEQCEKAKEKMEKFKCGMFVLSKGDLFMVIHEVYRDKHTLRPVIACVLLRETTDSFLEVLYDADSIEVVNDCDVPNTIRDILYANNGVNL